MTYPTKINEVTIRTELSPGDLEMVALLHGKLYIEEYQFGPEFEYYVREGLAEFEKQYDPGKDRVWVCEHEGIMVGFLLLMHRENNAAQLRYFVILPGYRGTGLGKRLMELFMEYLREKKYHSCYLWTVSELDTAASLYKRHGFRLTNSKPSTTFGRALTEQRYELVL